MKRMMIAMLMMLVLLAATSSQAGWRMRLHKGQYMDEFVLAGLDSVTFHHVMAHVQAGMFMMGDSASECGVDEREVTLTHDFYIGLHEVTNQEYMEALQWAYDNGYVRVRSGYVERYPPPGQCLLMIGDYCEIDFSGDTFYLRDAGHGINPDHPVKMVTWLGAALYCDWLNEQNGYPQAYDIGAGGWVCNQGDPYGAEGYRLPTDAEWEYAAQLADERIYPWGNEPPDCGRAAYDSASCVGWTSAVGSYSDAPLILHLSDMAGNVWEWCNDWWVCNLGVTPEIDPTGPATGTGRVLRGGSWLSDGEDLRCAARIEGDSDCQGWEPYRDVGFRIARTVNP